MGPTSKSPFVTPVVVQRLWDELQIRRLTRYVVFRRKRFVPQEDTSERDEEAQKESCLVPLAALVCMYRWGVGVGNEAATTTRFVFV